MPDVAGRQLQELGRAEMVAGNAASAVALDIEQQANTVRVSDAMNQLVKARTDMQVEALQLQGRNALERPDKKSLPDEYGEKLDEVSRTITQGLGNDAQRRAFQMQAGQLRNQFYGALSTHMLQQQREYQKETIGATIVTAQNQAALLWGDEQMRTQSVGAITAAADEMGKIEGWDAKTRNAKLVEMLTPLHAGVLNGMLKSGNATMAREYYNQNSAQMTIQARASMQEVIKRESDAQVGDGIAESVWGEIGPKGTNDAVRLFDMERAAREKLKDNPDALKSAISAIRERAQAFNAQQTEMNAQGVNSVFGMIDSGASMRTVRTSDAWLGLPEAKRHEITKALEAEAHARESRALTNEQRELTRLERADRMLLVTNGGDYLADTSPERLSTMTRTEVEALRTKYGRDATLNLLNRWDQIQKPMGKLEANIDTDIFNQVAEEMGMDPFKQKKTEDDKARLGSLKYRIERLIDAAQQQKKSALTRGEKEELVRGEMSRTVTVDPGWFSSNREVPVIALSDKQVGSVVVPAAERAKVIEALKAMNAQQPNNPMYAPTETNIKRLYLMGKSRAGETINVK